MAVIATEAMKGMHVYVLAVVVVGAIGAGLFVAVRAARKRMRSVGRSAREEGRDA